MDTVDKTIEHIPPRLGRYRVSGLIGAGYRGTVYKAWDDDLRREVAAKVPHDELVALPEQAETYLTQARQVARLEHPGIVPLYDVGRTDEGQCYVVTKL